MSEKTRIACVIGTRPEVIKMAPVIQALRAIPAYDTYIINTAQHRQLLDDMLGIFKLNPDIDLNLMKENQSLATLSGELFLALDKLLNKKNFDLVLAQGDTTTTLIASQVAFYNKIFFGHVEAGLRSHDLHHPFPEEMNRVFTSKIANLNFAVTKNEEANLLAEGIHANTIVVTGNTVIDALLSFKDKNIPLPPEIDSSKRLILLTLHRRESFGQPIKNIFSALIELVQQFNDIQIIYPVHPNPNVKKIAEEMLSGYENIKLLSPLPYDVFVSLLKQVEFVMTDSGGLQEEAPALNKPLLILRECTERPLVVGMGMEELVGNDKEKIVTSAKRLLVDQEFYASMQQGFSPYGDGHAAQRIVKSIQAVFSTAGELA